MGETLINPNQIRDGIGGKIKILNVVQTGTLTRDGAVFSGFSTSNYLQLGARVDKGILSLDSSTYIKDFGLVASQADSWEMVFKVKYISYSNSQMIFSQSTNYGTQIYIKSSGVIEIALGSGVDFVFEETGNLQLTPNQWYYIKWLFTGTKYEVYTSTDGQTYTLHLSHTSSTKFYNIAQGTIGKYLSSGVDNFSFQGDIDLSESYIKINGNDWWKGVETI